MNKLWAQGEFGNSFCLFLSSVFLVFFFMFLSFSYVFSRLFSVFLCKTGIYNQTTQVAILFLQVSALDLLLYDKF